MDQDTLEQFSKLLDEKLKPINDRITGLIDKIAKLDDLESLNLHIKLYNDLEAKLMKLDMDNRLLKSKNNLLKTKVESYSNYNDIKTLKIESNNHAQYQT